LAAVAGARGLSAVSGADPELRLAQIGTAHSHAGSKWQTVLSLAGLFEPVGIFEPDVERRAVAASDPDFAGAHWIEEPDELGELGLDAVLVETDLPDLVRWARFGLENGWHVHVDKPPGQDREGLQDLCARAAMSSRVLQMGYMYRYHPAFRFCLEAVAGGWLGPVFSIHGEIGKVVGKERRPGLADVYGGSMMLLGCHLLDYVVALLGVPDRVTPYGRRTFPEQDDFFDHQLAVLEYPDAMATVRSMLAEVGGADRRQFVVCGENGTIEIRPLEPARVRLTLEHPAGPYHPGEQAVDLPAVSGRYHAQLKDFFAMIRGRPSSAPEFGADHDLDLQDVLLRACSDRPGKGNEP
jgi:predicted dehydrogenase